MNFSLESLYSWYRSMIRNPQYRWWIVLGTLAYLWSPIDILPDIFPIIGWIDDGLLATLLVSEISQLVLTRLKLKTDGKQTAKPIVEVVSNSHYSKSLM